MNESAFEEMIPLLRQTVRKTLCCFNLSVMEREDIAQDVMLRLWQMRDELDNIRSIEAFVIVVARHETLSKLRQRKPEQSADKFKDFMSDSRTPFSDLEAKDDAEWLEQRLKMLPDTQRTILYMRQVERRSADDIARLLGIAPASVSTLLARARRKLLDDIKNRR